MTLEADDLAGDIRAAASELRGEPAPVAVEAPAAPVETIETAPAADATPPKTEGKQRGADGKFKPKAEQGAEPIAAAPPAVEPIAAKEVKPDAEAPLTPPSHWKPQAKADFLNAPRAVQEQILEREADMETGRKEWAGKAEEFNQIDKVIGAHRDRWARDGKTPGVAIAQLLSAEKALQSDPVGGTEYLLQAYAKGNELRVIDTILRKNGLMITKATDQGQPAPGANPAPTNADNPTMRRLESTVQELTQREQAREAELAQARQADEERRTTGMRAEIEAVRADPKNVYFDNLREKIAALVSIGDRNGDTRPIKERVQAAYDEAAWADPTVRKLVMAAQQKADQATAAEAAKAKAAQARQASGSLTGSPGPGQPTGNPNGSKSNGQDDIRADLRAAMASTRA